MGKYLDYPNCSNEVTDGWVNYKNSPFECTIHRLLYPTLIMGGLSIVITLAKIFKVTFSLLMWGKLNRLGINVNVVKWSSFSSSSVDIIS
jgi:hypothetical protein